MGSVFFSLSFGGKGAGGNVEAALVLTVTV